MNQSKLNDYVNWRRTIFDPKGDLDRLPFMATGLDLLKAARTVGQVAAPPDGENELTWLRGGSFNALFSFDTPEGSYVLRIPHSEQLAPSLLVEEWAANEALSKGVPTIAPVITDTSHYLVPFSFQILPLVKTDPDAESPIPLTKHLSSIRLNGYGPIDPRSLDRRPSGMHDTWRGFVTTRLEEHLAYCVQIGAMTYDEARQAESIIRRVPEHVDSTLVHGDLSPSNVIGGTLIDWESCLAGDYLWDAAGWNAFYADQVIAHVVRPTDFWTYYLRIVLARTVHRARFGIPENPVYPKASARIQMALAQLT